MKPDKAIERAIEFGVEVVEEEAVSEWPHRPDHWTVEGDDRLFTTRHEAVSAFTLAHVRPPGRDPKGTRPDVVFMGSDGWPVWGDVVGLIAEAEAELPEPPKPRPPWHFVAPLGSLEEARKVLIAHRCRLVHSSDGRPIVLAPARGGGEDPKELTEAARLVHAHAMVLSGSSLNEEWPVTPVLAPGLFVDPALLEGLPAPEIPKPKPAPSEPVPPAPRYESPDPGAWPKAKA